MVFMFKNDCESECKRDGGKRVKKVDIYAWKAKDGEKPLPKWSQIYAINFLNIISQNNFTPSRI